MVLVPRRVRESADPDRGPVEREITPIEDWRARAAWVLLGEPGLGKSESLQREAEAIGGIYLDIADFIHAEVIDDWGGKTLFLDGLDEVRGGAEGVSILARVRARLQRLEKPRFRIACRAADWFGSTDRDRLNGVSPDGAVSVLELEPLSENDIHTVLRENHGEQDPRVFMEEARRRGVDNLLDNPQTLGLLAGAIRDGQWPGTREETFELACEKLAEESNKRHRDQSRGSSPSTEALLDAAGQLCATLLLSDSSGIALDQGRAGVRFPPLDECLRFEPDTAREVVRRKLFRPHGEERVVPVHRTVAEYLAARWLGRRIDGGGLPLGRLLNLMLGGDGRTVAGLRGLYAWLASHCARARERLIDADPLTVVVYGDAKPLPVADKRRLLGALHHEASEYVAFRSEVFSSHHFGALAEPELAGEFVEALESPERDAASQSFADCVLDILAEGEPIRELAATVRAVAVDASRWGAVRNTALRAWLRLQPTFGEALALLDTVTAGSVNDPDDELAGGLLSHLYPEWVAPESLFDHLHAPKNDSLLGSFVWFWIHQLPERAPEEHLPVLLDQLVVRAELADAGLGDFRLRRMVDALLVRGVNGHGDRVSDQRLFEWLGIGFDSFGESRRDDSTRRELGTWLESRPERYKALLSLCYDRCAGGEDPDWCADVCGRRLHGAEPPESLGLWHLERASVGEEWVARKHLTEAVYALTNGRGGRGLSLEVLERWGEDHPGRREWLEPLLCWEIPEWWTDQAISKRSRREQKAAERRERTIKVSEHIPKIRDGSANGQLMCQLAGVWRGRYLDIRGDAPRERFERYCDNGEALMAAAESGFRRCLERDDLPTVGEIVELSTRNREHYIRLPCLVGMELCWEDGVDAFLSLSDDMLRRMVAFRLTYGAEETPEWFRYLVAERPGLVAEVLVQYGAAAFKAKREHVDSIYPLEHDPAYKTVAVHAVPELLKRFPVRAKKEQLGYLKNLLRAALRYRLEPLTELIAKKASLKSMDVDQKSYWLCTGMLLDPERYEDSLWAHVGATWQRAEAVSGFLSEELGGLDEVRALSARTIGKLIESISPHADLDWMHREGRVTDPMRRGDHVRALSSRLAALGTDEAEREIGRLLAIPSLSKLKFTLENARQQLRLSRREGAFRFLALDGVTRVLANRAPVAISDLAALVVDHLDDIAHVVRTENDDGFRAFWNTGKKGPDGPRLENDCRDELLRRLRPRLEPLGVCCDPEADYFNDKRADIRVSYRNELELPIEIKREHNDSVWNAHRTQLMGQYSIAPRAERYGVYLVLWFGGQYIHAAKDGGKRPRSPEELRDRLEAMLDAEERRRIFVRVVDVSWPR